MLSFTWPKNPRGFNTTLVTAQWGESGNETKTWSKYLFDWVFGVGGWTVVTGPCLNINLIYILKSVWHKWKTPVPGGVLLAVCENDIILKFRLLFCGVVPCGQDIASSFYPDKISICPSPLCQFLAQSSSPHDFFIFCGGEERWGGELRILLYIPPMFFHFHI